MGDVCLFHYHGLEREWCLMLSILFWLIMNFTNDLFLLYFDFFHNDWTCVTEIKCSITFSCIFFVGFLSYMSFFLSLWFTMCHLFFTWFNLFCYLTWGYSKMVFWICLYFHEQVRKGVRKKVTYVKVSIILCGMCMHANSSPWRWNVVNVGPNEI